ncbi:hypothetical protein F5Y04DRAFT_26812 [Hypomontagnella monticulosa]|nr:hypothetical protein F5Y04DRAFT_26812 [Hypomontagnella monticulosa]
MSSDPQFKDLERGELPGTEPPLPPYEADAEPASVAEGEQQPFLQYDTEYDYDPAAPPVYNGSGMEQQHQPYLHFDPQPAAPVVYSGGEMEVETPAPPKMSLPMRIFTGILTAVLFVVGLLFVFTCFGLFIKLLFFVWKKIGLIG